MSGSFRKFSFLLFVYIRLFHLMAAGWGVPFLWMYSESSSREERFMCSLCHITISLEAHVLSNGVAKYILKVSNVPKLLWLLCSVIIRCSPFFHLDTLSGGVAPLGTQLDLISLIYFQVSCFSIKMICRFCVLSLRIKTHTHCVIQVIAIAVPQ